MRRLSARLVSNLPPAAGDGDAIPALGQALSRVRGRTVRLRAAAFPPATASGLWVNRTGHDLIVYEENTDPEHQLVIIGHEAWHMFEGHCGGLLDDHSPAASRTGEGGGATTALAGLVAVLAEVADPELPPTDRTDAGGMDTDRMDAALHFAARTDPHRADEEIEAERFGFRFATDVQAALDEARSSHDPEDPAGRIQVSMAHRFRRI